MEIFCVEIFRVGEGRFYQRGVSLVGIFWVRVFLMPKWGTLHLKILSFFCFSSFVFKENDVLNEEWDPSKKFVIVDKEQEDIDIDDTGD